MNSSQRAESRNSPLRSKAHETLYSQCISLSGKSSFNVSDITSVQRGEDFFGDSDHNLPKGVDLSCVVGETCYTLRLSICRKGRHMLKIQFG